MSFDKILLQKYYLLKQQNYKEIESAFLKLSKEEDAKVYCKKKCAHCCIGYLIGSEIEIELIKYFLSNNDYLKNCFFKKIEIWKIKVLKIKDITDEIDKLIPLVGAPNCSVENIRKYFTFVNQFLSYKIECPFLQNKQCLIYEIRPYVCANICSLTPVKFCKSQSAQRKIIKSDIPPIVMPFNNRILFKPIIFALADIETKNL